MQALKKYSGNIVKDILKLRNLDNDVIFPTDIDYVTQGSSHLLDFMAWNKEFVVFLDCDTDGLSAAAICNLYFSQEWCNNIVHYKMASRNQRGFQLEDVNEIHELYPTATGILTVDCGITSVDAVERAKHFGIDVLITDHHNPAVELPDTFIINPKLDNEYFGFKDFCGAGLIYLILRENFGEVPGALQYAAIATVADMVPLLEDNRYIVQQGMRELRNPKKKIKAIGDFFAGIGAFVLNEKDIGWSVAPTINSASRLSKEQVAFDAYVLSKPEAIQELVGLNEERKKIVSELYEYGKEATQVSENAISMALGIAGNPGVLGLVAMKLLSEFGLPAIAYCVGDHWESYYSMRAPHTSDFIDHLKTLPEIQISGGGHDAAGGFSAPIGTVFIIEEFHKFYDELYRISPTILDVEGAEVEYVKPIDQYEIEISLDDAINSIKDKEKLRPFGMDFEEPIFVSRGVYVEDDGMTKNKRSKRFRFKQTEKSEISAIAIDFNKRISGTGKFDIAYKISYNSFLKGPQIDIIEMNKI